MTNATVYELIEGQLAARVNWRDLPDLDDLLLEVASKMEDPYWWEDDEPTRLSPTSEPEWQWSRISPCFCGEHGWHWDSRRLNDDAQLEDHPARRFLALYWDGGGW